MIFYNESKENVLKHFSIDENKGISAHSLSGLMGQYGENKLKSKKQRGNFVKFISQFADAMIIILILASAISFFIACKSGEISEFFEPVLILVIVIVNAILGVMQENKAQRAIEKLSDMSSPNAKVLRGGNIQTVKSEQVVPGDIIVFEAGDCICADARLIKSIDLFCEESALTGESLPVEKNCNAIVKENAPVGDRINMVFSGSTVTSGNGKAIVCNTGMNTEVGKIARLLEDENNVLTPLQKKLSGLGKILGIGAVIACGIIFFIGRESGIPTLEIFMMSVSLAVSSIPEGLPTIVTIVLSMGVERMAKKNALIRRLPAVETLGGASVICSDKTGTLTQNKMKVTEIYCNGRTINDFSYSSDDESINKLIKYAVLCSNAEISKDNKCSGDPIEVAILKFAQSIGIDKQNLTKECVRLSEIPFNSDNKYMVTTNSVGGENIVIVKGAFEVLEGYCHFSNVDFPKSAVEAMANKALRVLAVAYKKTDTIITKDIDGLTFLGLIGFSDPIRPEAKEAVKVCKKAGIKPVMITGDHILTATVIAKELGIYEEGDIAVTGAMLDNLTEEEFSKEVENISVYARVSPENKLRIVKMWQSKNKVVAMTGDGVNDAPALKAADIGCAMGKNGTDVAKSASDMTLTDDNFATIVDAVREGRGIYANIRKVVAFLLGTNIGEVITVFFAMILWNKTALASMQLLWINLVTDGLPAVALGMEKAESDLMEHRTRNKNEGLFSGGLWLEIILQGLIIGFISLVAFFIGEENAWDDNTLPFGQTLSFMVLSLSQIVQSYNMRSRHSLFKIGAFTNKALNDATLVSVFLVVLVMFTPLRLLFGLVILPLKAYLCGLILAFMPLIICEIYKKFK